MTAVPLGVSSFDRSVAKTPNILLTNMILEKDPTNQVDGMVRFQRPGLTSFASVGTGPSRGVFRQLGTFNGDFLVVSGTTLYRVTTNGVATSLGTISGSGRVTIAASATRALIATGTTCYSTDGTTLTVVAMPSGENVSSVAYINSYFILTVANSQHFFWLAPGDVNPDALSFASAENSPDNIAFCGRIFDELWFFGDGSIEVWQPTGQLLLPFERINGRLYEKGCSNRDTVALVDNTMFFVGSDMIVYRSETPPTRVSDHGIEERLRIAGSGDLRAWAFAMEGHTYYCLRIGSEGTYVYDVENQTWGQWSSYGRNGIWRAHLGAAGDNGLIVAGDDTTGDLWRLDRDASNDNGDPMVRELIGGVALIGKQTKCANFSVYVATGFAAIGTEPLLGMRWSDDGGETWTSWDTISIGKQGQYGIEVAWRRLGLIRPPGRMFHVRMTDDTTFRISYARINEAFAYP